MDTVRLSDALSSVVAHPLTQHELDESESSSALTDPVAYDHLWDLTDEIMAFYKSTCSSSSDNTCEILGSFRRRLSKEGRIALMTDIKTIGRDGPKLRLLARYLIGTILKPMKLGTRVRPAAIRFTSPDYDATTEGLTEFHKSAVRQQQKLQVECLRRDGFRCVFSHFFDRHCALKRGVVPHDGASARPTCLTHILPLALGNLDNDSCEREALGIVWDALYRYFPALRGKIGLGNLDQYQNLVTFCDCTQTDYNDHLQVFDPIDGQPNRYRIGNLSEWGLGVTPSEGHQEVMTLVSSDDRFPRPDPEFFRVHYHIAKILEETGIGEEIKREMEASLDESDNGNPDGSTDL